MLLSYLSAGSFLPAASGVPLPLLIVALYLPVEGDPPFEAE